MKSDTFRLTLTALFVALTLLLGMTPLGLIPLGFVNVTILCVPVVVATMLLGLNTGLILGACFGLVSTLSMFGLSWTPPSGLAGALAARSPLLAIVMCFAPRLAVPLATWGVYRLAGRGARSVKAVPFAAAAGSLTNTVLYLGMMLCFYTATGLDNRTVLAIIGGTGLIAGGSEAALAALISTPILAALWKVQTKR